MLWSCDVSALWDYIATRSVTKNLVRGKNGPGGPVLVDKIWSGGTKFGYQNRSGPTKNGPV